MVKPYASLLALTLTTSLALAVPHLRPSYTHGINNYYDRDLLERDLVDEDLLDASDDLEVRDPSFFFGGFEHAVKDVGKVADKGLHVADNIVENPLFQVAASVIPGDAEVMAAAKIVGALGKFKKFDKAIKVVKKVEQAGRKADKLKHLGGGDFKLKKAIRRAKQAHKVAKQVHQIASAHNSEHHDTAARHDRRHDRRDLEDYEKLSRRDLNDEERRVFGREYYDDFKFLAERDIFDDLD